MEAYHLKIFLGDCVRQLLPAAVERAIHACPACGFY